MKMPFKYTSAILCMFISIAAYSQKVVFVIADGIPADVIEKLQTPNLKAIAANGVYMRAHVGGDKGTYSETPTISAVGYNSLLTGTWVNKHNVWDNDIKAPNYNYPTIFRLLKEQYPAKKTAVYSSWLDNRTKLVGDGLPQTNNLHVDFHADGFELDTVKFPHDTQDSYMHNIDEEVINNAAEGIRNNAPDLSWVYLEYTDDMGHAHGDSKQMYDAVAMMDAQVGRLWQAIQYRQKNFKEKWLIVITTDHGRSEKDGRGHGGQSSRQRNTWIVANTAINTYAKYYQPGIVDIMPTIARFMNIRLTGDVAKEIDGVPFTGPISIAKPELNLIQGVMDVSWEATDTTGNIKIWVSTTNNFKTGGKDEYKLLATVRASVKHAGVDVSGMPSEFYKVVLEGKYNTTNKWWGKWK
jgi:hypothetical protein